jgi:PAS domain S-box-containing protein
MQLAGPLDLGPALNAILQTAVELHDAQCGLLTLFDPEVGALCPGASVGFDETAVNDLSRVIPGPSSGGCGSAFATQKRIVIFDTERDPRFDCFREVSRRVGFRAVHSTPISLRSGEILGVLSVHFSTCREPSRLEMQVADLCARQAAEVIESVKAQEAKRENESRHRQLVEALPAAVYMTDADGRVMLFNHAAVALWGRVPRTGHDLWCGSHRMFWPDGTSLPLDQCPMAIALKERRSLEGIEAGVERPDGTRRNVLAYPRLIHDSAGNVVGAINVLVDITERKRMENDLMRINAELEEFAYVASHDIQEPLRTVSIYAQKLLRRQRDPDEESLECVEFIRAGINRMNQLIRDLLSYSRTIQEDDTRKRLVQLSTCLDKACKILKTRIEETGAELVVGDLSTAFGDEALVEVFQNLLSNALKYIVPGRRPRITITAEARGRECVVSVRDNGIGFDQHYAQRIFGLFKRLHRDEYPGTGLGLAICKRIIERHGGRIWAESEPGLGSVFSFALPLDEGPNPSPVG